MEVTFITETLVREFLTSHPNYQDTLTSFLIDSKKSILNTNFVEIKSRSTLSKTLGVYPLYKQNKVSPTPLKSLLEVILAEKLKSAEQTPSSQRIKSLKKKTQIKQDVPKNEDSRSIVQQIPKNSRDNVKEELYASQQNLFKVNAFTSSGGQRENKSQKTNDLMFVDQLDIQDLEADDEFETSIRSSITSQFGLMMSGGKKSSNQKVRKLNNDEIVELKKIIFGHEALKGKRSLPTFTSEWKGKGFIFSKVSSLAYGLVQLKGGPCGILAAVQAHIIKNLVFNSNGNPCIRNGKLRPTYSNAVESLLESLSEIIWRSTGLKSPAIVAMYDTLTKTVNSNYYSDGFTEDMDLFSFTTEESLKAFLKENIDSFMGSGAGKYGIIQLLYSAILSRGIKRIVKDDFDDSFSEENEPSNTLIGRHCYCTQEMVGLLLFGKAIGNVFDGDMPLDGGKIMRGIHDRCEFGYLTLYEHYKSLSVGYNLKNPQLPIFIICSESHFTVLFSLDSSVNESKKFDLFYYDGLANQDEEIKLTISPSNKVLVEMKGELVPPLNHCINTKWANSIVDWNGTDPLL